MTLQHFKVIAEPSRLAWYPGWYCLCNGSVSCAPLGPTIVEIHSYMLSPLGPALQLHGGSRLMSASSFWMRLALEDTVWPFIGRYEWGLNVFSSLQAEPTYSFVACMKKPCVFNHCPCLLVQCRVQCHSQRIQILPEGNGSKGTPSVYILWRINRVIWNMRNKLRRREQSKQLLPREDKQHYGSDLHEGQKCSMVPHEACDTLPMHAYGCSV